MTLHRLVRALGGDLYAGGHRANIPAPGHSARDRSISLLLTDGRVILHGFGSADWRDARDWLCDRGFIDATGRLTGGGQGPASSPRPDRAQRRDMASRLWAEGVGLDTGILSRRYLTNRTLGDLTDIPNLRHHPSAPTSVYSTGAWSHPALMARISDEADDLTAIELTYLDPNGTRASGLRLSRKTVGTVPPRAAVRLAPAASEMLVGEGVLTTLSAMRRFGLPGWALRAANNLAAWTPPCGVRRVLIAADNGLAGLRAARRLRGRFAVMGVIGAIRRPDPGFEDWNAVDVAEARSRREEGGC